MAKIVPIKPSERVNLHSPAEPGDFSPPAEPPSAVPLAARRHPLVEAIETGLERCGVLVSDLDLQPEAETKLVIGVSGGADSVSLLLGCLVIKQRQSAVASRLSIVAGHVHHHLRDAADVDAEWVKQLCQQFEIELHIEHIHPGHLPGNVAATARKLRYEALARVAKQWGAAHIAVAHHGEDQLETMLRALCRGAGLDGLKGMPWSRRLDEGITLVRPLLSVRKSDCRGFCAAAGVQWREDPSNVDITKLRARLRRDVMPLLEELWPDAARRVSATADVLEAARLALEDQLGLLFGAASQRRWDRAALQLLPMVLIAAGLRRAALDEKPDIADALGQKQLLAAARAVASKDRQPRRFEWPGGLVVRVNSKSVSLARADRIPRRG